MQFPSGGPRSPRRRCLRSASPLMAWSPTPPVNGFFQQRSAMLPALVSASPRSLSGSTSNPDSNGGKARHGNSLLEPFGPGQHGVFGHARSARPARPIPRSARRTPPFACCFPQEPWRPRKLDRRCYGSHPTSPSCQRTAPPQRNILTVTAATLFLSFRRLTDIDPGRDRRRNTA